MWTVDVAVQNDSCRRLVTAQFQFAPRQFGVTAYKVMLARGDDAWHRTPDNYVIRVLADEVNV